MKNIEKDALGNRMKMLEGLESSRFFLPGLPVMVRLDGRSFSSFTRGMSRPFDTRMITLMQNTTKRLVEETNAVLGYTQSDEISLVIHTTDFRTQPYFGGRVQKICSTLSAVCSVYFNSCLSEFFPDRVKLYPTFDCRVWTVPSLMEAANTILWRELDATKNSVQMAARSMFSHKVLQDLNGKQLKEKMLTEKNVSWEDNYPTEFKRGSFFQRVTTELPFTQEELDSLPEKHAARTNPGLVVKRSKISRVVFPPLSSISNIVECLFDGQEPKLKIQL